MITSTAQVVSYGADAALPIAHIRYYRDILVCITPLKPDTVPTAAAKELGVATSGPGDGDVRLEMGPGSGGSGAEPPRKFWLLRGQNCHFLREK